MFPWNEREQKAFVQRLAFATELHEAGVEGEELLSRLYCEYLPDTARKQGDWMASHVLEQIRRFDETQANLLELDGKIEKEKLALLGEDILNLMEGFALPSQCRKLHSINQGMDALSDICQGKCSLEEVERQIPTVYRGNTGEAGRNAGLQTITKKILAFDQPVRMQSGAEQRIFALRQDWMDEDLYRAILSIVIYTMMVHKENVRALPELPISVEYITVEVCCLASAQERKSESPEAAQRSLAADSAAVKLFLASAFLAGGTATVMLAGSAVAVYTAYYLTSLAIDGLIVSATCSTARL